jgi:hypothetical protein
VLSCHTDPRLVTLRATRRYALWCVLLGFGVSASALGDVAHHRSGRLAIDVFRDRLTLAVTRYPQVYLHGEIDAEAPRRFEALMRSGHIPAGSDIYLNVPRGDPAAAMALGRMFRAAGMATHLGTPRKPRLARKTAKTAVCVDACVYAYLGGLYRWTPSGSDHLGLTALPSATAKGSSELTAYLQEMGIQPGALARAATPRGGSAWLSADPMLSTGLANNGRLPVTASYNLSVSAPTLELRQVVRKGTHRLTIQCQPGKTTVTAYDEVGLGRARQIVARGTRSYFQLNQRQVLELPRDGAGVADNALMIRRSYPPAELVDLVSSWSFGAWVGGRNNAFRDGFSMPLHPVFEQLKTYFYACWRAAPWPPRQNTTS